MSQLLEYLPLVLFFITYKMSGTVIEFAGFSYELNGLYSATLVLMICYSLLWISTILMTRKNDKRLMWSTLAVMVLGGATLLFQSTAFIMWKPTVFNWCLALAIIIPKLIGKRSLLKMLMGAALPLDDQTFKKLEYTWAGYFFIVGLLNIIVAYSFSEAAWVDYKLYSSIIFSLLICVITAVIAYPSLAKENKEE